MIRIIITSLILSAAVTTTGSVQKSEAYLGVKGKNADKTGRSGMVADSSRYGLDLKTFIYHSGKQNMKLARIVLEGFGTEFDDGSSLADLTAAGKPQAIIIAKPAAEMTKEEFVGLHKKCSTTKARLVWLNAVPELFKGVIPSNSRPELNHVAFNQKSGTIFRDVVNGDLLQPIQYSTAQPAKINSTASKTIIPVLTFTNPTGSDKNSLDNMAAFISLGANSIGCEEMMFMFDAGFNNFFDYGGHDFLGWGGDQIIEIPNPATVDYPITNTNLALGQMWFVWATRGVFFGQRRPSLSMQIDDWFLTANLNFDHKDGHNGSRIARASAEDCEELVNQQEYITNYINNYHEALEGKMTYELVYNGQSFYEVTYDGYQPMSDCSVKHMDDFNWVSHTWSHPNLNINPQCANPNKNDDGCLALMDSEIGNNILMFQGYEIQTQGINGEKVTPPGAWPRIPKGFSPNGIVTGEVSGVTPAHIHTEVGSNQYRNADTMRARWGYGRHWRLFNKFKKYNITSFVGWNSRDFLLSNHNHHPLFTTDKSHGADGIMVIPRWIPELDYRWGLERHSPPARIKEMAMANMFHLLTLRQDPFMFHQANAFLMRNYGGEEKTSYVTYFTKMIIEYYNEYIKGLPIVSYGQDELAKLYLERYQRDTCGITGSVVFDGKSNSVISVQIDNKLKSYCQPIVTFTRSHTETDIGFNLKVNKSSKFGRDTTYTFGDNSQFKELFNLPPYGGFQNPTPGDQCIIKCMNGEGYCDDFCGPNRACCQFGYGPAKWFKGCWGNMGCEGAHCCVDAHK